MYSGFVDAVLKTLLNYSDNKSIFFIELKLKYTDKLLIQPTYVKNYLKSQLY